MKRPRSPLLVDILAPDPFDAGALLAPAVEAYRAALDVVDTDATLRQFTSLRPHVVFHAAAHKHVPLMEDHPSHAVTNNFFGTKSVADAALATGVQRDGSGKAMGRMTSFKTLDFVK